MIHKEENDIEWWAPHWGPLLLKCKIPEELIEELLVRATAIKTDFLSSVRLDARRDLAGVIDKEFYFEEPEKWFIPKFENYIGLYIEQLYGYMKNPFKNIPATTEVAKAAVKLGNVKEYAVRWDLYSLWVNFQGPKEYNPPHNHGGHLSFVIYLQIPKEIGEERNEYHRWKPGEISFSHSLDEKSFNIGKYNCSPERGDVLIFPAWLMHHVFAFNSDVERISVSGNISLEITER